MSTSQPVPAYGCPRCHGPVFVGLVHHCPSSVAPGSPTRIPVIEPVRDAARVHARMRILGEVADERSRQEAKFPLQELPNGTGTAYTSWANLARAACDHAAVCGDLTWRHILEEEFAEALAEDGGDALRTELIHVAAVAVRWIEAIDRRAAEQRSAA